MNAIEFDNVGKQYRLGLVSTGTLSHDLNRWWTMNVLRKDDPYLKIGETNDRSHKGESEYVWALKDINFKVEQGDVVGIIGKNGAGKSTLLKLLSRVTAPTTGCIRYRGRIASLLEVGTGFHPEMTGRENIYMNGAIMGMTKQEITRKLDEIVDFSGCERYIDTPVKRYSSGMTVRLGFAIAAHLEPEILVVDEVLAVGDAEFQKKAIGKMQEVSSGGGRTVLFVSHNMDAVKRLCRNGILLENGTINSIGSATDIVNLYLSDYSIEKRKNQWQINESLDASIIGIRVYVEGKDDNQVIDMSDEIKVCITYYVREDLEHTNISFCLYKDSSLVFYCWDIEKSPEIEKLRKKGYHKTEFTLPNILMHGKYTISVDLGRPFVGVIQSKPECANFEIVNIVNSEGVLRNYASGGIIRTNIEWKDVIINN